MAYNVVDLSKFNPVNDYRQLAASIDGAIIRAGYRAYGSGKLIEDPLFKTHVNGLLQNKAKIGIYFFTTAINTQEAKEEAEYAVSLIKDYKISFPIFVDTEMSNNKHNGRSDSLNKVVRTNCIIAFCERIKQLGYEAGVYASDYWFISQLDFDKIKNYNLWVASYSKAPVRVTKYIGWQYTSTAMVSGVKDRVDMSYWYTEIGKKPEVICPYKKPNSLVKKGSKGENVRWVQYHLNKHGYNLRVDGDFGNLTLNAVRNFQSKNKLVVDGIVGPKTIAKLDPPVVMKSAAPAVCTEAGLDSNTDSVLSQAFETEPDTIFTIVDEVNIYKFPYLPFFKNTISGECVVLDDEIKNDRIHISSIDGVKVGWVNIEDIDI